ncbi:hypothetical protein LDENG_00092450 [Lucifuga dentata]|nr:hypothetical protein LDENG_00092450 [Lucifuga dentata]
MFQRASCDVRVSDYFQIYMENIADFRCGLRLLDPTVHNQCFKLTHMVVIISNCIHR